MVKGDSKESFAFEGQRLGREDHSAGAVELVLLNWLMSAGLPLPVEGDDSEVAEGAMMNNDLYWIS